MNDTNSTMKKRGSFQVNLEGMAEPLNVELVRGKDGVIDIRQPFEADGKLFYGKSGFRVSVEDLPKLAAALLIAYDDLTGATLQVYSHQEDEDSDAQDYMADAASDFSAPVRPVYKWERTR